MSNKTITFSDFVCEFENWILEITCYFGFDIWDFTFCQKMAENYLSVTKGVILRNWITPADDIPPELRNKYTSFLAQRHVPHKATTSTLMAALLS